MCWGDLGEQRRWTSLLSWSFCGTELCGQRLPSRQQWFLHPSRSSFALKSSLITLGHTALPGNSTAVNVCMIYLALSLCGVNCFLCFYSSLWSQWFDLGQLEGWELHENGDHSFCICRFTEAAHRMMLCTPNWAKPGPTLELLVAHLLYPGSPAFNAWIAFSTSELIRTTNSKMSEKGQILSMK